MLLLRFTIEGDISRSQVRQSPFRRALPGPLFLHPNAPRLAQASAKGRILDQASERVRHGSNIALLEHQPGLLVLHHLVQRFHRRDDDSLFHRESFQRLHRRNHLRNRLRLARERRNIDQGIIGIDLLVGNAARHDQPIAQPCLFRDPKNLFRYRTAIIAGGVFAAHQHQAEIVPPIAQLDAGLDEVLQPLVLNEGADIADHRNIVRNAEARSQVGIAGTGGKL